MLQIWMGTDRKRNTELLLEELCRRAEAGAVGQLILVPEQFSHSMERLLCKRGGPQISRSAEVLGFSRLAARVFSQVGGCAQGETDMVGRLLAMALAVEQVQSRLKIYGASAAKPEFLLRLLETMDEFRSFCVTPERLRQVCGSLTGVLAEKSEEFALLMESYDTVCMRMGQNPRTRLERLLEALEESDFACGKSFWLDGFTDFNGVEQELIAQLLNKGAEVTVVLQCPGLNGATQQFSAAQETARQLVRLAGQQGEEPALRFIAAQETASATSALRACLFSGSSLMQDVPDTGIAFLSGSDRVEECRVAAGEILRLAAQGVRWREISIAFADFTAYRPILESLLRRAEIPAYFAGKRDILRQSVVHMLLSALEAAVGSMDTETVLSYLKSGFLPLEQEHCDRLENYVLLWSISGARWEQKWSFCPYGLQKKLDAAGQTLLQELNADREVAIAPLLHLRRGMRGAKNTGQMVQCFYAFMEELALAETLDDRARRLHAAGQLQAAQEYVQVYGLVCAVLEQMYGVLGESVRTPEEFYRMLRTALSQCEVGTIPASLDCVTVGSLLSQRRCDTPYVFLLGAQEGMFPEAQARSSLLTDSERHRLQSLGIALAPTAAGALEREFAAIDSILNAPERCLYLGAPEGKEAFLMRRALALFPQARRLCSDEELVRHAQREYLARLVAQEALRAQAAEPFRARAQELSDASLYRPGALSPQAVRRLYRPSLRLSASKIDALAGCRFSFFLKYGLNASPRKPVQMDSSLYGTFVHDVLEVLGRRVMAEGGFHTVSLKRTLEIAEEEMEAYTARELAPLWQSARAEYLFRRNFSEVRTVVQELYEELSASEFEPRWFELRFAADGTLPAIRIIGKEMTAFLEGKVDRVDVWQHQGRSYVRIVDYKTGRQSMEYTRLYYGLGLQMLLYLFAFVQTGARLCASEPLAAGVLYFPARVEKISLSDKTDAGKRLLERRKSQRRSGLLLDSEPVLQAMEPCEAAPRYLPYAYNKAGERVGDLFATEQLARLREHVLSVVAQLGDELYCGSLAPNPYFIDRTSNACQWCEYASVCRQKDAERWLEKIKDAGQFWQKLEEGKEHG